MITNDEIRNTEITFYGISRTIEVLTDLLKEYNLVDLESYKIKDVIECIIKLDEQLNKYDIKARAFLKHYEEKK